MNKTIRWGIMGTGLAARSFAGGLLELPDARLSAVSSRTLQSARSFAAAFHCPTVYASNEELVRDPEIDIVYIATPHTRHNQDCLLAIAAGKPVLCEKPFAVNAREAEKVIRAARRKGLFCMEAMWMRFIPLVRELRGMIPGALGEVRSLRAEFGYAVRYDPEHRLFNPRLAGGALLDRGVYPISLAYFLFGPPERIVSQAVLSPSGVDEYCGMLFKYSTGIVADLSASTTVNLSNEAVITGTSGTLRVHAPFYNPERVSLVSREPEVPVDARTIQGSGLKAAMSKSLSALPSAHRLLSGISSSVGDLRRTKTIYKPARGSGYRFEAAEAMRCLYAGETESPLMPLDETLMILKSLDGIRRQWKLRYPVE